MTEAFWICMAGMAWGAVAGYIKCAVDRLEDRRQIARLCERIETLVSDRDTWRKVADNRLKYRKEAA